MLTIPSNPKQRAFQSPVSTAAKAHCLHDTSVSDAVLISQDGVEFPVLSSVLRLASAGKLLSLESPGTPSSNLTESTSTSPIIHTSLPSTTLAELLRLCYLLETFDISNLSLLCNVYAATKQWNITKITSTIQRNFRSPIDNNKSTISLYFHCNGAEMEAGSTRRSSGHCKKRTTGPVCCGNGRRLLSPIL
jgi:hypothetical protein